MGEPVKDIEMRFISVEIASRCAEAFIPGVNLVLNYLSQFVYCSIMFRCRVYQICIIHEHDM